MANPASRSDLQEYALRRLGKGVIDINVSTDQIDDRTDEALQFFQEYHFDGVEKVYLKHKITATTLTVTDSSQFTLGEKITGGTSSATAFILDAPSATTIRIYRELGDFTVAETITGGSSSATDTVSAIVAGDIKNGWVPVTDAITGVVKVFPFTNRSNMDMFDVRYQLRLNDLYDFSSTSIIHYDMTLRHLDLLDHILVGERPLRFNQHKNRLYIDMDWQHDVEAGDYIVIECYRKLDGSTFTDVFDDIFLKKYLIQLVKRQWGSNLIKFQGVAMLGGVQMNGEQIYTQALEEIQKLEEQIQLSYELPPNYMVG